MKHQTKPIQTCNKEPGTQQTLYLTIKCDTQLNFHLRTLLLEFLNLYHEVGCVWYEHDIIIQGKATFWYNLGAQMVGLFRFSNSSNLFLHQGKQNVLEYSHCHFTAYNVNSLKCFNENVTVYIHFGVMLCWISRCCNSEFHESNER